MGYGNSDVRKADGTVARLDSLQVGDLLLDKSNQPVRLTRIHHRNQARPNDCYEVCHPALWGTSEQARGSRYVMRHVTGDQHLHLEVTLSNVTISVHHRKNGTDLYTVRWLSKCSIDLDQPQQPESTLEEGLGTHFSEAVERRVRHGIANRHCTCGLVREVSISASTQDEAEAIRNILNGNSFMLIDPHKVNVGHSVDMTVPDIMKAKHYSSIRHSVLKICRDPIQVVPDGGFRIRTSPWWIGLWLGDGTMETTAVTVTNMAFFDKICKLTDHANANRPSWAAPLYVRKTIKVKAGEWVEELQCRSNEDAYHVRISSTAANHKHSDWWNPFHEDLHQLGIYKNKGNLSDDVLRLSIDDREEMTAGFIDADGSYCKNTKRYVINQSTDPRWGHRELLTMMRKVTISCGIRCSGIHEYAAQNKLGLHNSARLCLYGERLADLQRFLLSKHIPADDETRRCPSGNEVGVTLKQIRSGEQFVDINVEGGYFQMGDGEIMCDSR